MSEFDLYCADRIFRINRVWDKTEYEIEVCDGYYGEEINGVYFGNEEKVVGQIEKVIMMNNNIDKLRYVLQLEYGYVIESVLNATSVSIIECSPSDIISPQTEYYRKLEKEVIESYKDYKIPCAVCRKRDDKYHIIDGYHRVTANQDKEKIEIIVIE